MNSNSQINLHYYLHDRKTFLLFNIGFSGNHITDIGHNLSEKIKEIQIITDCDPEQPLLPYPNIYKSLDTLDIQLAQIMAIESHLHCPVPEYARQIRLLLMELNRLYNHFNFFTTLADSVRFPKLLEISILNSRLIRTLLVEIDKFQALDTLFVIGGIASDLPTGFMEKLTEVIHKVHKNLSLFEKQLVRKTLLSNLLENTGVISYDRAKSLQFSGPNLSASLPQQEYSLDTNNLLPDQLNQGPIKIDFHKGSVGDSWHRSWIRFLEIIYSLELIKKLTNSILRTDIHLNNRPSLSKQDFDFTFYFHGAEGQIVSRISRDQHNHYITGKHVYPVIHVLNHVETLLKFERISSGKIILSSLNLNPIKYLLHR